MGGPFDASVLWKVKNKYDPNLTVLFCTFVHRGRRFIALKKCVTGSSADWPLSNLFFSPRARHKWIPGLHQAQRWAVEVLYQTLGACHQDLASTGSSFVSPAKGHSHDSLSIVLENEHCSLSPWFVSAELCSPSCGSIFPLWDSGCLVFSCFTGSQICRRAQNDSEFPFSDPDSGCSPVATDVEELSRRGHWSFANPQAQRLCGCL